MISQSVIHKLLAYCTTRESQSLLKELVMYACLEPQFIIDTINEYQELGKQGVQSKYFHAVFGFTGEIYDVTTEDILGKRRLRSIVDARRTAMVLAFNGSTLNKSAVSRMFGKDHATILHAIKTHAQLMEVDEQYNKAFHQIESMLVQAGYNTHKKENQNGTHIGTATQHHQDTTDSNTSAE